PDPRRAAASRKSRSRKGPFAAVFLAVVIVAAAAYFFQKFTLEVRWKADRPLPLAAVQSPVQQKSPEIPFKIDEKSKEAEAPPPPPSQVAQLAAPAQSSAPPEPPAQPPRETAKEKQELAKPSPKPEPPALREPAERPMAEAKKTPGEAAGKGKETRSAQQTAVAPIWEDKKNGNGRPLPSPPPEPEKRIPALTPPPAPPRAEQTRMALARDQEKSPPARSVVEEPAPRPAAERPAEKPPAPIPRETVATVEEKTPSREPAKPAEVERAPERARIEETKPEKKQVAALPSPPTPPAPALLATEREVRTFFDQYLANYNRKDLQGFTSFFSPKAVQNQKDDLERIRGIYRNFFEQMESVKYRVSIAKIDPQQNRVEVKGEYQLEGVLAKGQKNLSWKGQIQWVLVREEGRLKIASLDYQPQANR
ncbi:MAG TPA: hypothetical protein VLS90_07235, partial [Thermodesulfobacteriota bacterium]|nr:hypothetical protein [Thermodesulfobacteriota bacterium]